MLLLSYSQLYSCFQLTHVLERSNPMLAGNVVALLSPLIFIPVLTYTFGPQNYDYKSMALIRLGDDSDLAALNNTNLEDIPGAVGISPEENAKEQAQLARASVIAKSLTAIMTLALLVLWPMPMYGTGYVFSRKFFTGWVTVGIVWLFCSAICVGLYPLWEGRKGMAFTFKGIMRDLSGRGRISPQGRAMEVNESERSGSGTENEKEKDIMTGVDEKKIS